MGIGCVLFLWAIVAAIALAVAAVGGAIFLGSAAWRSKLGMIAGVAIGVVAGVVALGAVLFIGGWLFWGMWPHESTSRSSFADAFGVPAGAEVTEIRSRTISSTDSHVQFLRFKAPPPTIAALVGTRFKPLTPQECRQESLQFHDAPEWWRPSFRQEAECYSADPYDDRLISTRAWLHYDRTTGEAYFHYVGID